MDINQIFSKYTCRLLNENDFEIIYDLCKENKLYYHHCPPMINYDLIKEDMYGLPKGFNAENKYYAGIFDKDKLIGIIDILDGYPSKEVIYIGLFMLDINYQCKGLGTSLINECIHYFKNNNYTEIQLGYVKTNPQASHFWSKLGFTQCRDEVDFGEYIVIPVSKKISSI